jgi:hypothetical protein
MAEFIIAPKIFSGQRRDRKGAWRRAMGRRIEARSLPVSVLIRRYRRRDCLRL